VVRKPVSFIPVTERALPIDSPVSLKKGLVQIYTGDGKGKTTAAVGLIIRAYTNGLRIYAAVFMKDIDSHSEWEFLSGLPNVTIERFGSKEFCDPGNVKPVDKERASQALAAAGRAMRCGEYDLIVMDEVNVAVAWKLLDVTDVIKILDDKPANVELVLTGRYADSELIKRADLVTEMLKIKHPFDSGQPARKGIEY
jgi:cob(I)alamin adenosyltransferase